MTALSIADRLSSATLPPAKMLIAGDWVGGVEQAISHLHPTTGETVFEVPGGNADTVQTAVAAARTAFDDGPWARMPGRERARYLHRIAEAIRGDADNLASLLSLDNATPASFVGFYQMGAEYPADLFDIFAGWIDKITGETYPAWEAGQPFAFSTYEPVGVVGLITPWNAPLGLMSQKVAPALAAGCTIVAKPSEMAPLTSLRLGQLIAEADLPPGVFNIVTGSGPDVGTALVADPRVDKVSFTGSRAVGGAIASAMGARIGRVSLELGGKSPALIFADGDVGLAVAMAAGNAFLGMSGQVCVCQSRILVERSVHDEVVNQLAGFAAAAGYGDPFDPVVNAAPMISAGHRDRVLGHISRAVADGAAVAAGGIEAPAGAPATGNFVAPTVLVDVDNRMPVAREEIFGPVLCVIPFDSEDDAIRIANDSEYGLGAAIYTKDVSRAMRVSAALRAGNVGINTWTLQPHAPFGGVKQSGLGSENGRAGIMEYLDTKTTFVA
ncbi:aldehyde dehydrogenase family protein [Mycobacterium intracellulare]|uniref:aldehyde dehydrogenase family protein n=2 Tax=Mycobacterium intracellulare TaxID=1767 RepID=UPI000BAC2565|nr:aldehyde dehydrogenase family protein [Mycobacterium intracellulare]ASW98608.1 aldehyde dehydrogenase [Mycobacterium intracellulare subsp. chimaera]PBA61207.1 aldehyde dehydrogenase [Mycobacterium intracellulare subsp. chimaera]PBA61435.1 aldehyde dehydrogenase [Mycobacterium intracellulare subsp. chimaera]